jgi:hypothetical protein
VRLADESTLDEDDACSSSAFGGCVRISLGDVSLWFDVSGPSVIPQGDTTIERPVLVAVHGGPGLDHMTVKSALGPLAEDFQVLGSSFGGNVALTYAALFPDHPGGVILANTTGGHSDQQRVIEAFGGLGGPEAAAVIQRICADETEDNQAEFNRVCYPLHSGTPGWAEESRQMQARIIRNTDVSVHYSSHRADRFAPGA